MVHQFNNRNSIHLIAETYDRRNEVRGGIGGGICACSKIMNNNIRWLGLPYRSLLRYHPQIPTWFCRCRPARPFGAQVDPEIGRRDAGLLSASSDHLPQFGRPERMHIQKPSGGPRLGPGAATGRWRRTVRKWRTASWIRRSAPTILSRAPAQDPANGLACRSHPTCRQRPSKREKWT